MHGRVAEEEGLILSKIVCSEAFYQKLLSIQGGFYESPPESVKDWVIGSSVGPVFVKYTQDSALLDDDAYIEGEDDWGLVKNSALKKKEKKDG